MDYSSILEELSKASTFDLYRLSIAINQQLETPQRLDEIKRHLQPGQKISYFDAQQNREIEATVLKIRRKRVLVQNLCDQAKWTIPLYFINLEGVNTDIINTPEKGLDKSQLKVGDMVGFQDRDNNDLYGKIIRLNQKTATIMTSTRGRWRVGYEYLYFIFDIEQGGNQLIIT
ncbi:MAG: hypothetical protein Q3M24_07030 [Candidatus Electrothrix aestuarii]|uniref:Uncharacterized protein n=1 Tax=Candidatus Electrothrix aestuarii TaxID=3062594 RepID=A0AAU8M017_9BACT|nr:hypothetical protein [Candidatus Electrothrix aestuarii]